MDVYLPDATISHIRIYHVCAHYVYMQHVCALCIFTPTLASAHNRLLREGDFDILYPGRLVSDTV